MNSAGERSDEAGGSAEGVMNNEIMKTGPETSKKESDEDGSNERGSDAKLRKALGLRTVWVFWLVT